MPSNDYDGLQVIVGVDEVGRGPLCGPVVACAAAFPIDFFHKEITDSKKLSAKKRETLYTDIKNLALAYSIVAVGHKRIDKINIRNASKLAMELAVSRVMKKISTKNVLIQIDGNMKINTKFPQETIIKGDLKIIQIGAASILAKVYRDNLMKLIASKYPGYDIEIHAGYPTKKHRMALQKLGRSKIHRESFKFKPCIEN